MKDLAVRLAALDADAGEALRVIAYFDSLVEARAGLQSIVRGAAVLAGCAARLDDDERRLRIRVEASGVSRLSDQPADASWPCATIDSALLRLETAGPAGPVEAMVLERASGAARTVLDRTRGRAPAADPASAELIVDASAPSDVRRQAARRLGLTLSEPARAVALDDGRVVVTPAAEAGSYARAGIGPAVPIDDLPASYTAARVALRFAAEGTDEDPGRTVIRYDDLGGLVLLAAAGTATGRTPATGSGGGPAIADVRALEHAAAAAPWALSTLQAVAETVSLRAAATALRMHHSTLQDRVTHAEHLLGWNVREPQGRLRLQLALALRRLHRHP
jgi:hypothetical protein